MKELPIIFNTETVKAILEGRKTQARRPIKPQPKVEKTDGVNDYFINGSWNFSPNSKNVIKSCPHGKVGDKLWVRETFGCFDRASAMPIEGDEIVYMADKCDHPDGIFSGWKPSIHMPRWASRITLEITDVRVERVGNITFDECLREGIIPPQRKGMFAEDETMDLTMQEFERLWGSIYAKTEYKWSNNPWVWVVEFKRID